MICNFFIDLIAYFLDGSLRSQPTFTLPKAPERASYEEIRGARTFTKGLSKDDVLDGNFVKSAGSYCLNHDSYFNF